MINLFYINKWEVLLRFQLKLSYKSLSEKYKLSHQEIVKRWVNAYKSQGYEGLEVKKENTKISSKVKTSSKKLFKKI